MATTAKKKKKKKAAPKPERDLIVVESRAKATTLQKILGDGYLVIASFGHVRDLPTRNIGVNVNSNYEPLYLVPRDKKAAVGKIKTQAEESRLVYMATDPDREGEAIAWHLLAAAEIDSAKVRRISFHEITETAIQCALDEPGEIDMDLVNS
ncbi:MAG: toprim domain-containing protein, partial [Chloroflexota bacterium]|nr:toprim domain-containing protein [Chloroflexota bacterium]